MSYLRITNERNTSLERRYASSEVKEKRRVALRLPLGTYSVSVLCSSPCSRCMPMATPTVRDAATIAVVVKISLMFIISSYIEM